MINYKSRHNPGKYSISMPESIYSRSEEIVGLFESNAVHGNNIHGIDANRLMTEYADLLAIDPQSQREIFKQDSTIDLLFLRIAKAIWKKSFNNTFPKFAEEIDAIITDLEKHEAIGLQTSD